MNHREIRKATRLARLRPAFAQVHAFVWGPQHMGLHLYVQHASDAELSTARTLLRAAIAERVHHGDVIGWWNMDSYLAEVEQHIDAAICSKAGFDPDSPLRQWWPLRVNDYVYHRDSSQPGGRGLGRVQTVWHGPHCTADSTYAVEPMNMQTHSRVMNQNVMGFYRHGLKMAFTLDLLHLQTIQQKEKWAWERLSNESIAGERYGQMIIDDPAPVDPPGAMHHPRPLRRWRQG